MTDLIQALSTALARLATLEDIVSRIERLERSIALVEINGTYDARLIRLETLQFELGTSLGLTDRNVNRLEDKMTRLEDREPSEDLDSQIEDVLDRKLDDMLEDKIDSLLSGREITVTL
jgi:hypothetical protein